ncbi:MAG: 30S ribosome-binding factor RbfA [Pseudomonadota bacterium]
MADYNRTRRIGELIQREIAMLLQREIKDPRVKNLSITAVKVNRDLSVAKVYYSFLDLDASNGKDVNHATLLKDSQQGLDKASGFIRHMLGQKIQLRVVPKLNFCYDESIIHGANMSRLIDEVIAKDEKNHID